MNRDDIIRLAHEAGIIPWEQMEWSNNRFVLTDEGMDGDLACLMQFANLVAAAQRQQLTDEQISVLWHQSGEQPFKFARMLLK